MTDNLRLLLKQLAKIHTLPYWIFLGLFLFSGCMTIAALRHNNQNMIRLRGDVYVADKNNADVEGALNKLRAYVYGHMNTNLSSGSNAIKPPIQLKYTYDRLQAKAQAAANNSGLYTKAENYCQARIPASVSISGRGRISCVQDYILSHGGNSPAAIPAGLYEFDFVSPTWSPDFAGWNLVASIIFFILFALSFIHDRLARRQI